MGEGQERGSFPLLPKEGRELVRPVGDSATCSTCGAPILWVQTIHGRAMPLNPDPDPKGNVTFTPQGLATVTAQPREEGEERYMPHHATCPRPIRRYR